MVRKMATIEENTFIDDTNYRRLCQVYFALRQQNPGAIVELIQGGFPINYSIPHCSPAAQHSPDLVGRTALHFAVYWCKMLGVNLLLDYDADFTIKDANEYTALHQFVELVLIGLKRKGLMLQGPIANLILSAHVDKNITTNPINKRGLSHFHIACMANHTKAVKFFLDNGTSVEQAINSDSSDLPGYTPLHIATRCSSLETVILLLKYGADVNAKDGQGMFLLEKILNRNKEIIDVLESVNSIKLYNHLKYEFNINIKILLQILDRVNSISIEERRLHQFHIACIQGFEENIMNHLKSNVDVNVSLNFGYTALHYAAHFHYGVVKILLSHGANILAKDMKGKTPFEICVQKYHAEVIDLIDLIEPLKTVIFSEDLRLRDILYALRRYSLMAELSENKSFIHFINASQIPVRSPVWPGYTPLHLAVVFSEQDFTPIDNINECCNDIEQTDEKEEEDIWIDDDRFDAFDEFTINGMIELLLEHGADFTAQNINGQTPLHLAFRTQNLKLIKYILSKHSSNLFNPYDNDGLSHFHIACLFEEKELIELFLRKGVQAVNTPIKRDITDLKWLISTRHLKHNFPRSGWTPLHIAVACQHHELVTLLIHFGADIFAKDADGLTPIHAAVNRDYHEIIDILFSAPGAMIWNPVVAETGLSHLHAACISSNSSIVEALLRLGADANAPVDYQSSKSIPNENHKFWEAINGYTPMHFATRFKRIETLKLLFKHKANAAAKDSFGWHPLHRALEICQYNYKLADSFSWLLFAEPIDGMELSQLHIACAMKRKDAVESLLKSGVDVNSCITHKSPLWPGYTPLHMIVEFTHDDVKESLGIIELLLKYRAAVTIKSKRSETPVHLACRRNKKEIAEAILTADGIAMDNVVNNGGASHLHIACTINAPDVIEKFLKNGAKINEPQHFFYETSEGATVNSCYGFTPLHIAAYLNHKEIVNVLLRHGADVRAEDYEGRTPLHIACKESYVEVVDILLSSPGIEIDATTVLGETPLQMAVQFMLPSVVETLLKHGARINILNPVSSTSAFTKSLFLRDHKYFKMLISTGIDAADIDSQGVSSLHRLFLTRIIIESPEKNLMRYLKFVDILLERGCDVDCQDMLGKTPLHVAVTSRNVEGVTALLMNGADVNVTDHNDKTAFELLLECNLRQNLTSNIYKSILFRITRHIQKLQSFQLPVNQRNRICYDEDALPALNQIEEYIADNQYTKELEKMQGIYLSKYSTLGDTLKKGMIDVAVIERNEVLQTIMNSEASYQQFPQLIGILKLKCKMARKQRILLENAEKLLPYLTKMSLPRCCCDNIAKYLNSDDLRCINEVFQSDQKLRENDEFNDHRIKRLRLE